MCDEIFTVGSLNNAHVRASYVEADPQDYGIPESRNRKYFPFYGKHLGSDEDLDASLRGAAALFYRMKEFTAPVTLADVLLDIDHPFVRKVESEKTVNPECLPSAKQKASKKRRTSSKGTACADPEWYLWHDEHREHFRNALGEVWVHPSANPMVLKLAEENRWVASLPWRELDLCTLCTRSTRTAQTTFLLRKH